MSFLLMPVFNIALLVEVTPPSRYSLSQHLVKPPLHHVNTNEVKPLITAKSSGLSPRTAEDIFKLRLAGNTAYATVRSRKSTTDLTTQTKKHGTGKCQPDFNAMATAQWLTTDKTKGIAKGFTVATQPEIKAGTLVK